MSPSAKAPPIALNPTQRVGAMLGTMNLRLGFVGAVVIGNAVILLCLISMSVDTGSALGVLRPLIEDVGLPRDGIIGLFAVLFGVDVAQMRQMQRRQSPGYGTLTSLSGQLALALITLVYVIKGALHPIALYGAWGVFLLSLVGVLVVIQSYESQKRFFDVRQLMYPAMSVSMGLLAFGLIWPGSAISAFIQQEWDIFIKGCLLALVIWGCGELKQNHLTPKQVARRIGGMLFFAFFSVKRFTEDRDASVLGTWMHVMVWVLAVFFALIQAQDYGALQPDNAAG